MKVLQHYVLSLEPEDDIYQIEDQLRDQNFGVEIYEDDRLIEVYGDEPSEKVINAVLKELHLN